MTKPYDLNSLVYEMSVNAALLNPEGFIVEVSDSWRQFADSAGMRIANYGIGKNYLKYCVCSDPHSIEILRGVQRVLAGKMDCFTTIYPCAAPDREGWFLLVAFAACRHNAMAVVLHFEITQLLRNKTAPSAAMVGMGDAAVQQAQEGTMAFVRRAVLEAVTATGLVRTGEQQQINASEAKKLSGLNRQQIRILGLLGVGASNAEIAKAHSISLSAAKAQSATVIRKLGLMNRSQAALFAVRNGIKPD